jgi:hypothetical protein
VKDREGLAIKSRESSVADPGSGSGILDEQPGSYFRELTKTIFWVKIIKICDADPGWKKFGSGIKGWKKFGSGINVPRKLFTIA